MDALVCVCVCCFVCGVLVSVLVVPVKKRRVRKDVVSLTAYFLVPAGGWEGKVGRAWKRVLFTYCTR